jgi:DNA-binding HxlR family transcriptional regulator
MKHAIIEQGPAPDGSKWLAYRLTRKGLGLKPVLAAMRDWGLEWDKDTRVNLQPARA